MNVQGVGSEVSYEEFESMRSSFVEGVRQFMQELERSNDSWDRSSVPDMEQVLLSLLDEEVVVATPFQLSEQIRSALSRNGVVWNFEMFK